MWSPPVRCYRWFAMSVSRLSSYSRLTHPSSWSSIRTTFWKSSVAWAMRPQNLRSVKIRQSKDGMSRLNRSLIAVRILGSKCSKESVRLNKSWRRLSVYSQQFSVLVILVTSVRPQSNKFKYRRRLELTTTSTFSTLTEFWRSCPSMRIWYLGRYRKSLIYQIRTGRRTRRWR